MKIRVTFNRDKSTRAIEVTDAMLLMLAEHGADQKANDAYANAKAKGWTDADCRDRWSKVIDSIERGEWTVRRESRSGIDGVIWEIAEGKVKAQVRAKGHAWSKIEPDHQDRLVQQYIDAKSGELRKMAEARMAEEAALGIIELNL